MTTERILIRSGIASPTVTSLNLATLSDLAVTQHRNGYGTISFGAADPFTTMFGGAAWPGVRRGPSLESLSDARQVYTIIRDAQKSRTGPAEVRNADAARLSS